MKVTPCKVDTSRNRENSECGTSAKNVNGVCTVLIRDVVRYRVAKGKRVTKSDVSLFTDKETESYSMLEYSSFTAQPNPKLDSAADCSFANGIYN